MAVVRKDERAAPLAAPRRARPAALKAPAGEADAAKGTLKAAPAAADPSPPSAGRPATSSAGRRRQTEALEAARKAPTGRRYFGKGIRKVDVLLKDEDVGPYEQLMRRPESTLADLAAWLHAHGYQVGRSAVRLHRVDFRDRLAQARAAATMANEFTRVARRHGGATAADAAALHAEQRMMELLFRALDAEAEAEVPFDPQRWQAIHKAIGEMAKNRQTLETIRQKHPGTDGPSGDCTEGGVGAEAGDAEISRGPRAAAGRATRGRGPSPDEPATDYRPLCDRVRQILGLPPLPSDGLRSDPWAGPWAGGPGTTSAGETRADGPVGGADVEEGERAGGQP